jgi:predicted transcriptional regulator
MESKKSTSTAVERFADLGVTEISVDISENTEKVLAVFVKYPTKFFTQKNFVEGLNKSNPWINKILRRLTDAKIITRSRNGNKFYYTKAQDE